MTLEELKKKIAEDHKKDREHLKVFTEQVKSLEVQIKMRNEFYELLEQVDGEPTQSAE